MYNKKFMELAIAEAKDGIKNGHGGPFGAVVVKDGEVVASGHNSIHFDYSQVSVYSNQVLIIKRSI